MDSLTSNIKTPAAGHGGEEKNNNPDQPSNSDLMSSAKTVAEAAQSVASNKTDTIDKPKVAGATADLVDSVEQYGKFDESKGVGQYLKQADDYLHHYEKSGATGAPVPVKAEEGKAEEKGVEGTAAVEEKRAEGTPPVAVEGEEKGGFAAGEKVAGSFFK